MTEDFLNGLNIVPLSHGHSILSSTAVSDAHPWRDLYQDRDCPPDHSTIMPSIKAAPVEYQHHDQLLGPPTRDETVMDEYPPCGGSKRAQARASRASRQAWAIYQADTTVSNTSVPPPSSFPAAYRRFGEVDLNETIRLCDVEAFRKSTAQKARKNSNHGQINGVCAGISNFYTTTRPVIYRYIDVIKNNIALLEAIHFELFMPDRCDLRFLGVHLTSLPNGTIEGDYFRISDANLLSTPSFAVKLGKASDLCDVSSIQIKIEYPVIWEANQIEKIELAAANNQEGLAYIVKKKGTSQGEVAISSVCDGDFPIRENFFPNRDSRSEHSLVRVNMKNMVTAQLYLVEPLLPPPPPPSAPKAADLTRTIEGLTAEEAAAVYKEYIGMSPRGSTEETIMLLMGHVENPQLAEALDVVVGGVMKNSSSSFDPRSEYLKRVEGVRASSQREGRVVSAVRALSASEAARIEDRLGAFVSYGEAGDLQLINELFRLGSRYREFSSQGMDTNDAGEMRIDESIVLRTIMDEKIGSLEQCRPLLDCLYGRDDVGAPIAAVSGSLEHLAAPFVDGGWLELNLAQSRAVRAYADADGPRVFCVRSPPGSGKTTVAAAMAAEVARTTIGKPRELFYGSMNVENNDYSSVQLLLAVQNVAVDNMGAALKKMEYGGGTVYNMKSAKKLNPRDPAPYDYFDLMSKEELYSWKSDKMKLPPQHLRIVQQRMKDENREKQRWKEAEECITYYRKEYEKKVVPKIILSTVEMMLQKMYSDSNLNMDLAKVDRVIIDEASLLTEAALFAIIRRFPEARIVLIGDDKQLPPFMYDRNILGHELAGRPALTVAMRTGRIPVVELNEVYRACPSLAAPYNRLAYGGRLVSRKPDFETPLSDIGLVRRGSPQLLLVDVDGREERNDRSMSLSNTQEINALLRLLEKFPHARIMDIMIICLYKEQKWRLQNTLNKHPSFKKCNVLTVDSAQGKEAPIVILMTTRTQRATDFFCSPERCNVAVSRQQQALVILGKVEILTSNQPWSTVVNSDDFTRIRDDNIR